MDFDVNDGATARDGNVVKEKTLATFSPSSARNLQLDKLREIMQRTFQISRFYFVSTSFLAIPIHNFSQFDKIKDINLNLNLVRFQRYDKIKSRKRRRQVQETHYSNKYHQDKII